jgi:hypothetical protein
VRLAWEFPDPLPHSVASVGAPGERAIADEHGEDPFTDIPPQSEETLRLWARQAETRHFAELGTNACDQLLTPRPISPFGHIRRGAADIHLSPFETEEVAVEKATPSPIQVS